MQEPHESRPRALPLAFEPPECFSIAWLYFLLAAVLGLLLRVHLTRPLEGVNSSHVLQVHSHLAFLGWVFNAFFALALRHFIGASAMRGYRAAWWVMQVSLLGMSAGLLRDGYGAVAIVFLTLHLAASVYFAARLWREPGVPGDARPHLRASLALMLLSNLGPLALGPLAALGLRDSPAYPQAVYLYLHFQYNGWFLFFLQSLWFARLHSLGLRSHGPAARRAAAWLVAGCLLTVALNLLPLSPPAWVRLIALAGTLCQGVGCVVLLRGVPGPAALWPGDGLDAVLSRFVARLALGAFFAKHLLQLLSLLPVLSSLATQRPAVIGFLHLVFLGVVSPLLILWAMDAGWLRRSPATWAWLGVYLCGALLTGLFLSYPTFAGLCSLPVSPALPHFLAFAAALMVLGLFVLALRTRLRG